jgi:hypothetical protein
MVGLEETRVYSESGLTLNIKSSQQGMGSNQQIIRNAAIGFLLLVTIIAIALSLKAECCI